MSKRDAKQKAKARAAASAGVRLKLDAAATGGASAGRESASDILASVDRWYELALPYAEDPFEEGPVSAEFHALTKQIMLWCDQCGMDPSPIQDWYDQCVALGQTHRPKDQRGPGYGKPEINQEDRERLFRKAVSLKDRIVSLVAAERAQGTEARTGAADVVGQKRRGRRLSQSDNGGRKEVPPLPGMSDDGKPFYKPKYFEKWNIGGELLRRNATDGKKHVESKVRRIKKKPAHGKGERAVYWYSERDARKRWPDRFKMAEDERNRKDGKLPRP